MFAVRRFGWASAPKMLQASWRVVQARIAQLATGWPPLSIRDFIAVLYDKCYATTSEHSSDVTGSVGTTAKDVKGFASDHDDCDSLDYLANFELCSARFAKSTSEGSTRTGVGEPFLYL